MSANPAFRTTIRLCGVSRGFVAGAGSCTASVAALQRASVEIRSGEVLAVVGPPGAGKTTLLLCAAGMLHFDSGEIVSGVRRVVYRNLARQSGLDGWPANGVILLDSCDAASGTIRSALPAAIERAIDGGAAVVLAAREPGLAVALAPSVATINIVHLRLGKVTNNRAPASAVHRVAEVAGGGY